MKKFTFAFSLFLLGISLIHADVVEPGTHPVERCVFFNNAENVSGVAFVAHIDVVSGEAPRYIILNGKCLEKGYKFNTLSIFALSASEIEKADLQKIDLTRKTPVMTEYYNDSYDQFTVNGVSLPDDIPLEAENLTYEFVESAAKKYSVRLIRVLEKNKGSSEWKEMPLPSPVPSCESLGGVCTYVDEFPECDKAGCPSECGTGNYGVEGKCAPTEKRFATCCVKTETPFASNEPVVLDEPSEGTVEPESPPIASVRNENQIPGVLDGITAVIEGFLKQIVCFYGRLFGGTC